MFDEAREVETRQRALAAEAEAVRAVLVLLSRSELHCRAVLSGVWKVGECQSARAADESHLLILLEFFSGSCRGASTVSRLFVRRLNLLHVAVIQLVILLLGKGALVVLLLCRRCFALSGGQTRSQMLHRYVLVILVRRAEINDLHGLCSVRSKSLLLGHAYRNLQPDGGSRCARYSPRHRARDSISGATSNFSSGLLGRKAIRPSQCQRATWRKLRSKH